MRYHEPTNDDQTPLLSIGPFGGIDPTTEPYYVAESNWVDSRNLVPNTAYGGYVTTLGRSDAFTGTLPGQCKGMYRFARSAAPEVYIFAVDNPDTNQGELWYAQLGGAYTQLSLPIALTIGRQYSFAVSQRWLFVTNGLDTPLKIDLNLVVTRWGISAPPTAPTLIAAGSSTMNGKYYYCITFANANQESGQGAVSLPITVTGTGVGLTSIPISTDSQVTQRNIYRQGGALGQWRLVATLNDNTTTVYNDTLADNQVVGQQLTIFRDVPPAFTSIIAHKERVWGFGTPSDPSLLYYSNLGEPWAFNEETGTLPVGENGFNDVAVGLGTTGSVLTCCKSRTFYGVFGDTDSNFITAKIADIGCTSMRSIWSAYGGTGWLSRQGKYTYDGSGAPVNISDGNFQKSNIKAILFNLVPQDYAEATSFIYDNMVHISFPTLNRTYLFDSRSQQWFALGFALDQVYFDMESTSPVIGTNLEETGEIDRWFSGPLDLGNVITAYGISKITDSGALNATKVYRYVQLQAGVQDALATYTVITNPGTLALYETNNIDLSTGGPFHQVSLPMSCKGNEVQLKLLVRSPQRVHIQKIAILGQVDRLNTEPGNG